MACATAAFKTRLANGGRSKVRFEFRTGGCPEHCSSSFWVFAALQSERGRREFSAVDQAETLIVSLSPDTTYPALKASRKVDPGQFSQASYSLYERRGTSSRSTVRATT